MWLDTQPPPKPGHRFAAAALPSADAPCPDSLLRARLLMQIGQQIGDLFVLLESRERHAVARNVAFGILEIGGDRLVAPHHTRILHGVRVLEAWDAARLPAKDPDEVRTYLVLLLLNDMAGLASVEDLAALVRVSLSACRAGNDRDEQGRGAQHRSP